MAQETRDPRQKTLDEISAARRAAMLRFAIQQQEAGHYSEALDMYRQLVEGYPGTEEQTEARERMLDLAHLFAESQPYRMLSLYNTLETAYAPTSTERITESRRDRVRQILKEVHEQQRREAETQARLEAIRDGAEPPPEPATMPPRRKEPAREPQQRATPRQGGVDVG